jgi:hypothetical protein
MVPYLDKNVMGIEKCYKYMSRPIFLCLTNLTEFCMILYIKQIDFYVRLTMDEASYQNKNKCKTF